MAIILDSGATITIQPEGRINLLSADHTQSSTVLTSTTELPAFAHLCRGLATAPSAGEVGWHLELLTGGSLTAERQPDGSNGLVVHPAGEPLQETAVSSAELLAMAEAAEA